MPTWQRFTALAALVVTVHAAGLWGLHAYKLPTSLNNPAPALQTRAIEPPKLSPPQQPVATTPTPVAPPNSKIAIASRTAPAPPVTQPVTPHVTQPTPAATAPLLAGKPSTAAPSTAAGSYTPSAIAPSAAPVAAAGTSPAEQTVQLPSADADHADTQYRHPRPAISTRLGESGQVLVKVQVGLNGKPLQVLVVKSSGFDRLDDNAVNTVLRWKFHPGVKNGVPEVMWVEQSVRYDPP